MYVHSLYEGPTKLRNIVRNYFQFEEGHFFYWKIHSFQPLHFQNGLINEFKILNAGSPINPIGQGRSPILQAAAVFIDYFRRREGGGWRGGIMFEKSLRFIQRFAHSSNILASVPQAQTHLECPVFAISLSQSFII